MSQRSEPKLLRRLYFFFFFDSLLHPALSAFQNHFAMVPQFHLEVLVPLYACTGLHLVKCSNFTVQNSLGFFWLLRYTTCIHQEFHWLCRSLWCIAHYSNIPTKTTSDVDRIPQRNLLTLPFHSIRKYTSIYILLDTF